MVSMAANLGKKHSSRQYFSHCFGGLCSRANSDPKVRCAMHLLGFLAVAEMRVIAAIFGQAWFFRSVPHVGAGHMHSTWLP